MSNGKDFASQDGRVGNGQPNRSICYSYASKTDREWCWKRELGVCLSLELSAPLVCFSYKDSPIPMSLTPPPNSTMVDTHKLKSYWYCSQSCISLPTVSFCTNARKVLTRDYTDISQVFQGFGLWFLFINRTCLAIFKMCMLSPVWQTVVNSDSSGSFSFTMGKNHNFDEYGANGFTESLPTAYAGRTDTFSGAACLLVGWLLNVPATCKCISGSDLLWQFYALPHWDRSCRSNFPSHPVTVYWHRANKSQHWPYTARRLAG